MLKTSDAKKVNYLRYIRIFAIDYAAILSLVYIFVYYYGYSFNPLIIYGVLFLAGYAVCYEFVREYHRPPNSREAKVLTFWSFICALIITFLVSLFFIDYYYLLVEKYRLQSVLSDTNLLGNLFVTILGLFAAYLTLHLVYSRVPANYIRVRK
ncbi:MAG: ABZJ_00895 family protein [Methyloligellaceae bacterium]